LETRERIIVYSRETRGLAAFICLQGHTQTSAGSAIALFTIKITHTNDKEKSLTKKMKLNWKGNEFKHELLPFRGFIPDHLIDISELYTAFHMFGVGTVYYVFKMSLFCSPRLCLLD